MHCLRLVAEVEYQWSSINDAPDMAAPATKREVTMPELVEALRSASARAKAEGQLVAFLKTRGFSDRDAEYITDTLGAYTVDDLQFVSIHMINEELDEIDGWQKDLLMDFCRAARSHYGRPTLEQQEQERLDAEKAA